MIPVDLLMILYIPLLFARLVCTHTLDCTTLRCHQHTPHTLVWFTTFSIHTFPTAICNLRAVLRACALHACLYHPAAPHCAPPLCLCLLRLWVFTHPHTAFHERSPYPVALHYYVAGFTAPALPALIWFTLRFARCHRCYITPFARSFVYIPATGWIAVVLPFVYCSCLFTRLLHARDVRRHTHRTHLHRTHWVLLRGMPHC